MYFSQPTLCSENTRKGKNGRQRNSVQQHWVLRSQRGAAAEKAKFEKSAAPSSSRDMFCKTLNLNIEVQNGRRYG